MDVQIHLVLVRNLHRIPLTVEDVLPIIET